MIITLSCHTRCSVPCGTATKGFHLAIFVLNSVSVQSEFPTKPPQVQVGTCVGKLLDKIMASLVSDQWIMDAINPQLCYITEQNASSYANNARTLFKWLFITVRYLSQCALIFAITEQL